ncbi:hypothetical protein [Pontibacter sp. HSC-36F09]|uniref:hypothetical protein n=1 Tax=Pontibacter sp. HSC-36F09 TaxID=2910966 RepID=UPI0020A0C5FF|nr:hypothetical protein [Pontibacter sp. HSC-36F09]MCP2044296.1 putative PilT family ATPase [Pontibacter sp. HSC-36F09]
MSELTELLQKLETCECDLIVLTFVGEDRLYCRFFKDGLYKDRMFISEQNIITELRNVSGEGEEIDASGISKLRKLVSSAQADAPELL